MSEAAAATSVQAPPKTDEATSIAIPFTEPTKATAEGVAPEAVTKPVEPKPGQTLVTKPAAPEKYELKLPDGSPLAATRVEKIAAEAKAQGLSNEQAQSMLERENLAVSDYLAHETSRVTELNTKTWLETLRADKDVGGMELEKNGQLAYSTAAEVFGEPFIEMIKKANLNNHPEFFKGMVKLAKARANDQSVKPGVGGHGAMTTQSIQEKFYGKSG